MKTKTALLCLLALPALAAADVTEGDFKKTITKRVAYRYVLRTPEGYGSDKAGKHSLILFLHGAGERPGGLDVLKQLGPMGYAGRTSGFPFIVAAPKCPEGQSWDADALNAFLDHLLAKYQVNPDRVYLTGFSMGGAGTWELGMKHAERFAAIAPLCGRAIPLLVGNLWKAPVWAFHGEKDDVVPISNSKEMIGYLTGMDNTDARLTTYPEMGHEIWGRVYSSPEIYAWFLQFSRKPPGG